MEEELYNETEIKQALEQLQISAFTKEELAYYDKYWDKIRVERSTIQDAVEKMNTKLKIAQQLENEARQREVEARQREIEARKRETEARSKIIDLAKMLKSLEVPVKQIIEKTGLSKEDIESI